MQSWSSTVESGVHRLHENKEYMLALAFRMGKCPLAAMEEESGHLVAPTAG